MILVDCCPQKQQQYLHKKNMNKHKTNSTIDRCSILKCQTTETTKVCNEEQLMVIDTADTADTNTTCVYTNSNQKKKNQNRNKLMQVTSFSSPINRKKIKFTNQNTNTVNSSPIINKVNVNNNDKSIPLHLIHNIQSSNIHDDCDTDYHDDDNDDNSSIYSINTANSNSTCRTCNRSSTMILSVSFSSLDIQQHEKEERMVKEEDHEESILLQHQQQHDMQQIQSQSIDGSYNNGTIVPPITPTPPTNKRSVSWKNTTTPATVDASSSLSKLLPTSVINDNIPLSYTEKRAAFYTSDDFATFQQNDKTMASFLHLMRTMNSSNSSNTDTSADCTYNSATTPTNTCVDDDINIINKMFPETNKSYSCRDENDDRCNANHCSLMFDGISYTDGDDDSDCSSIETTDDNTSSWSSYSNSSLSLNNEDDKNIKNEEALCTRGIEYLVTFGTRNVLRRRRRRIIQSILAEQTKHHQQQPKQQFKEENNGTDTDDTSNTDTITNSTSTCRNNANNTIAIDIRRVSVQNSKTCKFIALRHGQMDQQFVQSKVYKTKKMCNHTIGCNINSGSSSRLAANTYNQQQEVKLPAATMMLKSILKQGQQRKEQQLLCKTLLHSSNQSFFSFTSEASSSLRLYQQ
jgi:hypothetical protein